MPTRCSQARAPGSRRSGFRRHPASRPALPYLDVIRAAREAFQAPLAAYNVSGEYAMVKSAARAGWLDERAAALESLTAIKRAGADLIVSYWTKDLAAWL